jgi:hypothetical protein
MARARSDRDERASFGAPRPTSYWPPCAANIFKDMGGELIKRGHAESVRFPGVHA